MNTFITAETAEDSGPGVSVEFVHHPKKGAGLAVQAVAGRISALSTSRIDLQILINSRHAANCSWSTALSTPKVCFVAVPSPPSARRLPAGDAVPLHGLAQVAVYTRAPRTGRLQLLSVVEGVWPSLKTADPHPYVDHSWPVSYTHLTLPTICSV